jgi:CRP-like cAMP-binding protein
METIAKKMKCFAKYPLQVQRELCRKMTYLTYETGRVIVKQGHLPERFYIILSGTLGVTKRDKDDASGVMFQSNLTTLGPDQTFGELALLNNEPRSASIISRSTVELLAVDRASYVTIIEAYARVEAKEKLDFAKKIPLLKTFNERVEAVAGIGSIQHFPPNSPIILEGERSDKVFFIVKGSCRTVKTVRYIEQQHPNGKVNIRRLTSIEWEEMTISQEIRKMQGRFGGKIMSVQLDTKTILHTPEGQKQLVTKLLNVHILEIGGFFGLGGFINSTKRRHGIREMLQGVHPAEELSIVSCEPVSVLAIMKSDFSHLLTDDTVEMMLEQQRKSPQSSTIEECYLKKIIWNLKKAKVIEGIVSRNQRNRKERVLPALFISR